MISSLYTVKPQPTQSLLLTPPSHPNSFNSMANRKKDTVFVNGVSILAEIGLDAWGRPKAQPALISVRLSYSIERAGASDNIEDCMDYRKIYNAITKLGSQKFASLRDLAERVCGCVLTAVDGDRIEAKVVLPKGLLQSEGVSHEMVMNQVAKEFRDIDSSSIFVNSLVIPCVIGIGAHERPRKQPVVVDLKLGLGTNVQDDLLLRFERIFQVRYVTLPVIHTKS
jgi:FolB domain-containing protein